MKPEMSWTGKREHRTLSFELANARGSEFRFLAQPLLRIALHESLREATPWCLPTLEQDHLVWSDADGTPLLVALCLAFERREIGLEELERSRESIRKFVSGDVRTRSFLVVHNGEGKSPEYREAVREELQVLTASGRAHTAALWDRQRLLREAFNGMLRHTLATVRRKNLSTAPIEALTNRAPYEPLEEVPCSLFDLVFDQVHLKETIPVLVQEIADPAKALLDHDAHPLVLLTGGFGLGKTTAVARALRGETAHLLYVAGARISRRDVRSTKDFLQRCVDLDELLADFPEDDPRILCLLARPVIQRILTDPAVPMRLVVDGIDESGFLSRQGGFQHLFNILQEVRVPVVLTLRTELWERGEEGFARSYGLLAAHGHSRNRRVRRIELLSWDEDRIRQLLRRHRDAQEEPLARARLGELEVALGDGRFERLYGDIPRRPLFLRLILDSVADRGLAEVTTGRARLVCDWIRWKLYRDIHAPLAAGGEEGRLPIVPEVSDATAVEIAWEAMLHAAVLMLEEVEGSLELTGACAFEEIVRSSERLRRIEEPLGLVLNSLLVPVPSSAVGGDLWIRFSHRTFQEFFLAWFSLRHPGEMPAGRLPESVREWVGQIEREKILSNEFPAGAVRREGTGGRASLEGNAGAVRIRYHSSVQRTASPPDLELRVRTQVEAGGTRLTYTLHSATGVAPFSHREIRGPLLQGDPDIVQSGFLRQIEQLNDGLDLDGGYVLSPEARWKLDGWGRSLWQQLFNEEMRQAYRRFREPVTTLQIVSDEPWIPWEMIKPFDEPDLDDEFLAERFELTRWLSGDRTAPSETRAVAVACIASIGNLLKVDDEGGLISHLVRTRPGLRDASPERPGMQALMALLRAGGIGLFHFIGHGGFDRDLPDEASFPFEDGSAFRPSDLHGPVQTEIAKARPLVVFNACHSGRLGTSWTRLGGWAERWVRACGCAAFIGPQWRVRDSIALAFARAFYQSLGRGETLGNAARAARRAAREAMPGSPGWLAYTVYGHPNLRVQFGSGAELMPTEAPSAVAAAPLQRPPMTGALVEPSHQVRRAEPTAARSTNLRLKQHFTDRDRDRFVEESFEFIAEYVKNSLEDLQRRHSATEAVFRRIDQNHFTAAIYVNGKKGASCRVWLGGHLLGDIAYATGDSGSDNSCNETLTVEDDGYSLCLRPLMDAPWHGSSDRKMLTQQEGAEHLWSMLIAPLR